MFEFYKASNNNLISINPRCIVFIEPDGNSYTYISLLNGSSVMVKEKYEVVNQHLANYLAAQ